MKAANTAFNCSAVKVLAALALTKIVMVMHCGVAGLVQFVPLNPGAQTHLPSLLQTMFLLGHRVESQVLSAMLHLSPVYPCYH